MHSDRPGGRWDPGPPPRRARLARGAAVLVLASAASIAGCSDSTQPNPVITCGAGSTLMNNVCVVNPGPEPVTCGAGSTLMDNVCVVDPVPPPPDVLEPGEYESPWLRLQRIEGTKVHLHTDEVRYRASDKKLFQCAYQFAVLDVKDPANMSYLADNLTLVVPNDTRKPGCIHLSWDDTVDHLSTGTATSTADYVFTTHRGNLSNPPYLSGWNVSNKVMGKIVPTQLAILQESETSYEGIDVSGGNIYVALHEKGLGVYRYDGTANAFTRTGTATGFSNAWGVLARGNTVFVADAEGGLVTVDVTDPTQPTILGQVITGGFARGLDLDGNTAYVAAGDAGVVVVDVSDLANPTVIGRAETNGTAIRVSYASNMVYVAAWNDARAYDVSDPTHPKLEGALRLTQQSQFGPTAGNLDYGRPPVTARTLGIAAHDDVVFIGNWWLLYSYRFFKDRDAPAIRLSEDANTIDLATVDVGTTKTTTLEVTNQGTAPLTLLASWTDGGGFDVMPKQLEIAPGTVGELTISYTAADTTPKSAGLHILSDDPDQPTRGSVLYANRDGPAIGRPMPETTVDLLSGGELQTSQLVGKVVAMAYFATF